MCGKGEKSEPKARTSELNICPMLFKRDLAGSTEELRAQTQAVPGT